MTTQAQTQTQAQPARLYPAGATRGREDGLLSLALELGAVASGALGLLAILAAPVLEGLLGAPATFLRPLGVFLVGYAGAVGYAGTRSPVRRPAARAVAGFNALWVVASVALVVAGWLPLTTLGVAFALAQAGAVAVFAGLQVIGLRRARPGG
jgi:hypothetical protein